MSKICLELGNIESLYEIYDVGIIPKKMKVAMYLIKQFEVMKFDYDVVNFEEKQ